MHIVAVVVARGGSQRVPGKALRPFGDSTLIGHKIDELRKCALIDEVVVGSDDFDILREAEAHGATAKRRDEFHCDESVCPANEMIRDMVDMVGADVIVWAHPTNPLVEAETYDAAVREFLQRGSRYDSLCSVSAVRRHAWEYDATAGDWMPHNFDPNARVHPSARELPATLYQNGAIFIQPRDQMLANRYFYGAAPRLFEIDPPEDLDIDTEEDLHLARAVFAMQREGVPC